MDTDSNKTIWTVIIIAAVAIMGGLFVKFVPDITSQIQSYVQTVTDNSSGTVVDSDDNSDFTYSDPDTTNNTISITGYKGNATNLIIPEYRKIGSVEYKVTAISNDAFFANYTIKQVTIPDSVQTIGYGAFQSDFNLKSLTLGSGVTKIGDVAFAYTALTSVDIPDSVQTIGDGAFMDDSSLTSLTLGSGVTTIGEFAFEATALTSVDFPASLTSIDETAFAYTPLSSISFKSPVYLSYESFRNTKLTNVTLPKGSSYIPQNGDATFDSNVTVTIK